MGVNTLIFKMRPFGGHQNEVWMHATNRFGGGSRLKGKPKGKPKPFGGNSGELFFLGSVRVPLHF